MKAEVKELFIYNETYPLPPEKYTEFKTRLSFCKDNPMCVTRVKGDAETFISEWGKKNGSKLENGEESGFTFMNESSFSTSSNSSSSASKITEKPNINIYIILALIALGVFAVISKNMTMGIVTIGLAMVLFLAK